MLFNISEDITKTEQKIMYIVSVLSKGVFSTDFLGLINLGVTQSVQDKNERALATIPCLWVRR